jgi:NADH-quinone oxidoreductase subunit M
VVLLGIILILLLAAGVVVALPARYAFITALVGTLLAVVMTVYAFLVFEYSFPDKFDLLQQMEWVPALGLGISVGVDSISLLLIALTSLLGPICVLASATSITERVKTYFAWLLVLQAAMTGVFAARDIIFFYICFEFTLIPMWVLIHLYGSTNRRKAATKFFLYTFTGSMIALAGILYVVWHAWLANNRWTFDMHDLMQAAKTLTLTEQAWVMAALFAGFAVKVPLFPFHTWLPLAHTEAPTAGSVILAGVLLKLGTYGIYRFVLTLTPAAAIEYQGLIAVLAIVGIVYAGLICWVQTDVKKLVAYSSVAHLGFCILGMFAFNQIGLSGSVLYMVNHGLSTGALFLLIGMIYERYHTRSMKELGGLAARMPVWSTFMVFFVMASVGLPGLNGFVSEFLCLLGTFQADSGWMEQPGGHQNATPGSLGFWYALVAGLGMIIAAIYLLYMTGRIVWGELVEPPGHGGHNGHGPPAGGGHADVAAADDHDTDAPAAHANGLPTDLSTREIGLLLPLVAGCIFLGVYPKPVLDLIQRPVSETSRWVLTAPSRLPMAVSPTAVSLTPPAPAVHEEGH